MSSHKLSLIYVRKGATLRLDEEGDSVAGFLALSSYNGQYAFTWAAIDGITSAQFHIFQAVESQTSNFDFRQSLPRVPTLIDGDLLQGCTTKLLDIVHIDVTPTLSLLNGKETCLPAFLVHFSFQDKLCQWPQLWIEPSDLHYQKTVAGLEYEIRLWLRSINLDFLRHESEPNRFYIIDKGTSKIKLQTKEVLYRDSVAEHLARVKNQRYIR